MILRERNGVLDILRVKRTNRAKVDSPKGSVTLTKHQQIALRDWLCNRWGRP